MGVNVRMSLSGYKDMLYRLDKLDKDVIGISKDILLESGDILYRAIQSNLDNSGHSEELQERMKESLVRPHVVSEDKYHVSVETGFEVGDYNPAEPSGGFLALFNEYGTRDRMTKAGRSRGRLEAHMLVRRAVTETSGAIRKLQKRRLQEVLQ